MCAVRQGDAARVLGADLSPPCGSWRITAIMSSAVWKITQLASKELNLIIFSCSAGSLSAMTPSLPNRSPARKAVEPLDFVGDRGDAPPQRRVGQEAKQRDGAYAVADLPKRPVDLVLALARVLTSRMIGNYIALQIQHFYQRFVPTLSLLM